MLLDHLGLIAITGAEAAAFLQNQLTNDVQSMSSAEARLACVCSTKGRMLADFVCWRDEQSFYLECDRDLLASTLKHLSRFVLRAKAKIEDATGRFNIFGLAGEPAEAFLKSRFGTLPGSAWAMSHGPEAALTGSVLRVPDSMGQPRWQWIVPAGAGEAFSTGAGELTRSDAPFWRWLEIRAGLPHVTAATQDRFVPQMINFEAVGGVSFKKGCYPGQEVVARSQYLGKLKRRMTVAHSAVEPAAVSATLGLVGSDVVTLTDGRAGEALGTVVNAERSPLGGIDCLVELPVAGVPEGSQLATAIAGGDAIPIEIVGLPYPLPDQEIFVRPKL